MNDIDLLLDTDVLIDVLREHHPALRWAEENGALRVGIPVVVRMEILQGARNLSELQAIAQQLDRYTTLHLEAEDSARALEWFEQFRLSRGIGILDCFVAAIACRLKKPLCTFNDKHYRSLQTVNLLAPYSRSTTP